MKQIDRAVEIIAAYLKHGWRLRCVLLTPDTSANARARAAALFNGAAIEEAQVDALWFSRSSPSNREAWELRLIADTPYALFETFEIDESEEQREEMRREMEARLREYVAGD
jgi:hypothetical protein